MSPAWLWLDCSLVKIYVVVSWWLVMVRWQPEWSTAVIRDHHVATPPLLCHKEPARSIQSPLLFCLLLAGSLWHKRVGLATSWSRITAVLHSATCRADQSRPVQNLNQEFLLSYYLLSVSLHNGNVASMSDLERERERARQDIVYLLRVEHCSDPRSGCCYASSLMP